MDIPKRSSSSRQQAKMLGARLAALLAFLAMCLLTTDMAIRNQNVAALAVSRARASHKRAVRVVRVCGTTQASLTSEGNVVEHEE